MIYRRRIYKTDPEKREVFHQFFHMYLLPNQLKHGARLVGRWETEEGTEVTAIWEYASRAEYERIEAAVRQDPLHQLAQQNKQMISGCVLSKQEDFLKATGQYGFPKQLVSASAFVTNGAGEVPLVKTNWRADTCEVPGGPAEIGEPLEAAGAAYKLVMDIPLRPGPVEAARQFVQERFPDCQGALLAGSVVRGEATSTSDLDIVVFDPSLKAPYRESLVAYGWSVEVFVHSLTSYQQFFQSDCERARPSLPRMAAEGIVLKDDGIVASIKQEADELLARGPAEWPASMLETRRYFITDVLDDLIGSTDRAEAIFIAGSLAEAVSEFVLRANRQWTGSSKWVVRALKQYDEAFAAEFVEAFDCLYRTGEKQKVIQLVDAVLQPYGGRLFAGFSLGK